MQFDFSIISPSYNNLELSKKAITSTLKQEGVSFELIIVDDSTNDDIKNYINNLHDERIRYYNNKPSLGAVKNWNYGLGLAIGKYVILLHHDEYFYSKTHLKTIKTQIEKNNNDVVIAPICVHINENANSKKTFPSKTKRIFINHPILLFAANVIGPSACVCIKKENIQPFCEDLHWLVDLEWYYRMLRHKKACLLSNDVPIISTHGHKGQISSLIDIEQTFNNDCKIIKQLYPKRIEINAMLLIHKISTYPTIKRIIKKVIR